MGFLFLVIEFNLIILLSDLYIFRLVRVTLLCFEGDGFGNEVPL